jgi:hypothetical protein
MEKSFDKIDNILNNKWHYLIAIIFFSIVVIIWTLPLIYSINDSFASIYVKKNTPEQMPYNAEDFSKSVENDATQHLYYIWWYEHALINLLKNPFQESYVFYGLYKDGSIWLTYSPLLSFISIPFVLISNNPIFSYNLTILLTFVLTGFTTYFVIFKLFKNKIAALFSGFAYSFSHYRMTVGLVGGDLNLLGMFLIPLVIYYFKKFFDEHSYKNAIIFGILISLQIMLELQYTYYILLLLFLSFLTIYFPKKIDKGLLKAILISLIIILPFFFIFIIPKILLSLSGLMIVGFSDPNSMSPAPDQFFTAQYDDCAVKGTSTSNYGCWTVTYIPIILLILSICSIFFVNKKNRSLIIFYILMTIFFFILSLGTFSGLKDYLLGHNVDEATASFITSLSPFTFLWKSLPFFSSIRSPPRIIVITMFSLIFLASFTYVEFVRRLKNKLLSVIIGFFILSVFMYELYIPFVPVIKPIFNSQPYDWLKNQEYGVVMEYPLMAHWHGVNKYYMFYATIHKKPIINGFSTFNPPLYTDIYPKLNALNTSFAIMNMTKLNVKYVVIHLKVLDNEKFRTSGPDFDNGLPEWRSDSIIVYLNNSSNFRLLKKFDDIIIYEFLK